MVDEIRRVVCEVVLPHLTQNKDDMMKQASVTLKRSLSLDKSKVIDDSSDQVSKDNTDKQE